MWYNWQTVEKLQVQNGGALMGKYLRFGISVFLGKNVARINTEIQ